MKYRYIAGTKLNVSEVGFGVWTVSTDWWGRSEESDRVRLLRTALEHGVNFFDTGDTYGKGYGEEIMFKAFPQRRHDIVIGTKVGYDFYNSGPRIGHQERPQRFDPEFIRYACEQSLRRLHTDYIDLYQLHNPRISVIEEDEVFNTLEELVEEGKIRYYGVALGPDIGWFEEGEASIRHRKIRSLQIIYSILEQDPARRFFPLAEEHGVGLVARVPHASDVLTDKYSSVPEFDPSDHRAHRKKEWLQEALQKADLVRFLAEDTNRTLAQAAIKFGLAQCNIASVLPNITNIEELKEYAAAPDTPDLTYRERERLEELWQQGFYLLGESTALEGET